MQLRTVKAVNLLSIKIIIHIRKTSIHEPLTGMHAVSMPVNLGLLRVLTTSINNDNTYTVLAI